METKDNASGVFVLRQDLNGKKAPGAGLLEMQQGEERRNLC